MGSTASVRDVYDLFGTMDPAHVDALEDITADMREDDSDHSQESSSGDEESTESAGSEEEAHDIYRRTLTESPKPVGTVMGI